MRGFAAMLAALLLVGVPAAGQESLNTLLQRGYPSQWLVCGPFASRVDGGIVAALERGDPILSGFDHLAPVGGASAVRPRDGLRVPTVQGANVWTRQRVFEPYVNVSEEFRGEREGVIYAYFSTISPARATVYFDLQTSLGARVWVNGLPVQELSGTPVAAAGVNRFLTRFREGLNHVLLEIPLVRLDALARLMGTERERLEARGLPGRPLLSASTGFEFALRVLPVRALGDIAYVPRLDSSGGFIDAEGELLQRATLTLFNPGATASEAIEVRVRPQDADEPVEQVILPIPAGTQHEAALAVPLGDTSPGRTVNVEIELLAPDARAVFTTSILAGQPPAPGVVYVVTGQLGPNGAAASQDEAFREAMAELRAHAALARNEENYGFHLGPMPAWKTLLEAEPTLRAEFAEWTKQQRTAPYAMYGPLDQRIAGDETLVRNLAYGLSAARQLLGHQPETAVLWGVPALCPQAPQLYADAGIRGIVSDVNVPGLRPLFQLTAPNGREMPFRRKQPSPWPRSATQLQEAAELQRQTLAERGYEADVLIGAPTEGGPPPFFADAAIALRHGRPSVRASGAGADLFVRRTLEELERGDKSLPPSGRLLTTDRPGELIAQPALKQSYGWLERRVNAAERLSTLGSLLGQTYPQHALDQAWRQLLYNGRPDILALAPSPRAYIDALAAIRHGLSAADDALDRAGGYVASRIDTRPPTLRRTGGVQAIVVYNLSNWRRSDVCRVRMRTQADAGLTLIDESGQTVPYELTPLDIIPNSEGPNAEVAFVAKGVPPFGYRTYHALPRGTFPEPDADSGTTIENETLRVEVDPELGGAVVRLLHKPTGQDFVARTVNDLVAIEEAPSRTNGGRELWTTGRVVNASDTRADVVRSRVGPAQRLTVTLPFAGGTAVRTLTLFDGVPRLDCAVRLSEVSASDTMLAIVSGFFTGETAPKFGERFGAVAARRSPRSLEFRTGPRANPSATGVQPAVRWAALTPTDHLRFGHDIAVPLRPAAILHDGSPGFSRVGETLVRALARRGIPASSYAVPLTPPGAGWDDGTMFEQAQDDLRHGAAMRIVLGTGDHTQTCARLCARMQPQTLDTFLSEAHAGTALFLYDEATPPDLPPVPTLLIGAHTPEAAQDIADAITQDIAAQGYSPLPRTAYLPESGPPMSDRGVALLAPGTVLMSATLEGELVMPLGHGAAWQAGPPLLDPDEMLGTLDARYALYPFGGDWRTGGVVRAAHAYSEPLHAVVTTVHAGELPASSGFLAVHEPGFVVTAIKPVGNPSAQMRTDIPTARGGIILRGYETWGAPYGGLLQAFNTVRTGSSRDLLELEGRPLNPVGSSLGFEVDPFTVETLHVLVHPGTYGTPLQQGDAEPPLQPVVHSRYWQYNPGAAPAPYQPVTVRLDGSTATGEAVTLTIANNLTDQPVSAPVALTSTPTWRVTPEQFSVYLAPLEHVTREIAVLPGGDQAPGSIAAEVTHDGVIYRDVLERNEPDVDVQARSDANEIVVTVRNDKTIRAHGYVELIVPPAWWPERPGAGSDAVRPYRQFFRLAPGDEERLVFFATGEEPPWVIVKTAANGGVQYRRLGLGLFPDAPVLEPPIAPAAP
jgi:hypothetical protein